jgi:hypothetical protein
VEEEPGLVDEDAVLVVVVEELVEPGRLVDVVEGAVVVVLESVEVASGAST